MKARLVTNDGCEKIMDISVNEQGQADPYYRTIYIPSITHHYLPSGYGLADLPVTYATKMYVLVGYDSIITSKSHTMEKRAVYWEE